MTIDREKLARVLGMLGSAHDGEVLAAARQAERLRREAGSTWQTILQPPTPQPQPKPFYRPDPAWRPVSVHEKLEVWGEHFDCCLSEWERDFYHSVKRRRQNLTERQMEVVEKTYNRLMR